MKIIVPTDFSEFAGYAYNAAISLAKKNNAKLEIIHAIHTPIDWMKMDMISPSGAQVTFKDVEQSFPEVQKVVAAATAKLHQLRDDAKSNGVDAQSHLVYNTSIVEAIQENAETDSIIVMGSHGSSGFKEVTIGSNAQKVVRELKQPVLIIKESLSDFDPKNVVYASNFEESDLNNSLADAAKLAGIYGAQLNLLYINTPSNFKDSNSIQERINSVVKEYGLSNCSIYIFNHYTVDFGIHDFLKNGNYDLLIMPSHGYTGIQRFISFGVVEGMVNHIDIPILKYSAK